MNGKRIILLVLSVLIFIPELLPKFAFSKKLDRERIYEPVVLRGNVLASFYDVPIAEIFMYAYDDSARTWRMMPFQIDEMNFAEDPFKPGESGAWQDFYFAPDDGLFDFRDELVFIIRDLGDKAPDNVWIDNDASKNFDRLEIKARDPNDPTNCAYGYLFRSATITEEIPAPYGFRFDPENQIVESQNYQVRLSKDNGLIEDVIIKPPFGMGIDIFDTQKLRFVGVFDLGIITIPIGKNGGQAANERDNLYVYNESDTANYHLFYTPKPVVRLIREVRHTIRFGTFRMDQTAFYVRTKFYPFSGTIAGGADLDPETLKKEFQSEEDIYIRLELLRQSWDYNSAAIGMKFFNRHNQDIMIDGVPDAIEKTILVPIKEWTLTSGDQGAMFTHVAFDDATWKNIEFYFYDNKAGGQGDDTFIEGGDTGDSVSYGDQGILFRTHERDSVSLKLNFTAYFLPKNLTKSDGEKLAYWVDNPAAISSKPVSFSTQVSESEAVHNLKNYELFQNYPNPFNSLTTISFVIPERENVNLKIVDLQGRTVAILARGWSEPGVYKLSWNGLDNHYHPVGSGVYLCELHTKKYSSVKKLILLR